MPLIGYARVSTDEQDTAAQHDALREHRRGHRAGARLLQNPRSKGDQEGEGATAFLSPRRVRAIMAWQQAAGDRVKSVISPR